MADAVSESFSGRRETEVTSMSRSSSRLSFFSSLGVPEATLVCASALPAQATKTKTISLGAEKPSRFRDRALPPSTAENSFIVSDNSQTREEHELNVK